MLENCFGSDTLKKTTVYKWHEKTGERVLTAERRSNGKIEDGSDGYTDNKVPKISRAGSSAGTSALQSMGNTLKGTISLLMNKTCILNFLNEFRELFDQGILKEQQIGLAGY